MKEDILKTDGAAATGKYKLAGAKNSLATFGDTAGETLTNAKDKLESTVSQGWNDLSSSTEQFRSMASSGAKKTYDFVSKYKYQVLAVVGVAGVATVSYMFMNRKRVKAAPIVSATKKLGKKIKKH